MHTEYNIDISDIPVVSFNTPLDKKYYINRRNYEFFYRFFWFYKN